MFKWSAPLSFTPQAASQVPTGGGVFYLLADESESSAVYIGAAKNLREEFAYELEQQRTVQRPKARFFRYAETLAPHEQATRLIGAHKRKFGQRPVLNSGF
ncbi:hypothetical protein [Hyphobacterium marinum]|uniref:GIY-YIG domain-containing protein n=1 Tax=Hyphobacterium marinum TaxID=3116574 RepID=A0ABU7LVH2_9PROT|nr:hypothetical protein [Hyphobacterium sp. Y6023]MEE2565556.1 hypothetical protein [Hyphobacterium sp. Y6023]